MSIFLPTSRTFAEESMNNASVFNRTINKFSQDVASCVNNRTIGIYSSVPTPSGNKYMDSNLSSIRRTYNFSTLLSGTNTTPSGIPTSQNLLIVALYGIAQASSATAIPVPYVNVSNFSDSIGLYFDFSTYEIVLQLTTSNWVNYACMVVIEYLNMIN